MSTKKSVILNLFMIMVLTASDAALALEGALLGLSTGAPLVSASPLGSCTYANGVLTIETTPSSINYDGNINTNDIFNVAGTAIGGTLTYTLVIDNLGNLNPVGSSLTMSGLTQDAQTLTVYGNNPGPLLTGDITDFGIADGGANDTMDIRATVTGGDLAAIYPTGAEIASVFILEVSDYTFDPAVPAVSGFGGNWTCVAPKGSIGPFGEEETCDLTITKVVDKPQIGPFPPVGDDSDSDSGQDNDDGHTDNSDTDSGEPNESDSGPLPTDCGCKGKVSKLVLDYSGASAEITITRKPQDVVVFGPQIVNTGDQIVLNGPLSGPPGFQGTLGTRIEIVETGGGVTEIHTSCSQPIGPYLIAGDWTVVSGESKKLNVPLCPIPPTPCAGEIVTYTYTVTNGVNGSPFTSIQVADIPLGPIEAPFHVASGEQVVLMESVCITETTHNTVTASGNQPSGALCTSNQAEAWVEVLLPPDLECPVGGGSDSDSGFDRDYNADTDNSDSDSGDMDCDGDSEDDPPLPMGLQGCTPGYWKKRTHFDSWVAFDPGDKFEDVFPDAGAATGNNTLLKVLKTGGGKSRALGRHAVAAILNASHPDVDYPYNVVGVQQIVNDTYAGGTSDAFNAAKNILSAANQEGCPLNSNSYTYFSNRDSGSQNAESKDYPPPTIASESNGGYATNTDLEQHGDPFTISDKDNSGTTNEWVDIYVGGKFHTRIYTSCSEPIGPGLISGQFEIISGESQYDGKLCSVDLNE